MLIILAVVIKLISLGFLSAAVKMFWGGWKNSDASKIMEGSICLILFFGLGYCAMTCN